MQKAVKIIYALNLSLASISAITIIIINKTAVKIDIKDILVINFKFKYKNG